MRVAGNKLKHLLDFYFKELGGTYDIREIQALFQLAAWHYLGYSSSDCTLKLNDHINQSELIELYDCCKDLKKGIPIQYIFGETEFYKLTFKVNPAVLIPRPETEELVELVIRENKNAGSALDIGTGSGCIPVTLKKNLPDALVSAFDISDDALKVATENAKLNEVEVNFVKCDILNSSALLNELNRTFDIIISNPPYIKQSEKESLAKQVIDHEPHLALFVDNEDAIVFYRRIIDLCKTHLGEKGRLYFELNPLTADDVKNYALKSNLFGTVELLKDMSGNIRFLKATK